MSGLSPRFIATTLTPPPGVAKASEANSGSLAMYGPAHSSRSISPLPPGVAALEGPMDSVVEMREEYRLRRDFVVDALNAMDHVSCQRPQGAFYAFPRIDFDMSSVGRPNLESHVSDGFRSSPTR